MKRISIAIVAACFVRTSLAAEGPTGDDYLNFFSSVVGEWNLRIKTGDVVLDGTCSIQLSASRHSLVVCMIGTDKKSSDESYQSIEGYDPDSKRWMGVAFPARGGHVIGYLKANTTVLKGKQATFEIEGVYTDAEGKKGKFTGLQTITIEEDKFTILNTNGTVDGETVPDGERVCQRKK